MIRFAAYNDAEMIHGGDSRKEPTHTMCCVCVSWKEFFSLSPLVDEGAFLALELHGSSYTYLGTARPAWGIADATTLISVQNDTRSEDEGVFVLCSPLAPRERVPVQNQSIH